VAKRPRAVRCTRALAAAALAALVATACSGGRQGANPAAGPSSSVVAPSTPEDSSTTSSTTTSTSTTSTTTSTSTTTTVPEPEGLRSGVEGPEVLALQQRLTELGYWLGTADATYGSLTVQAVMAFQKANGLSRDGIAGPATLAALATASRPAPSVLADGIEIDLERQLLFVVRGGQVLYALNTSTGTSGWRTPPGDFTVVREVDGMRHAPLGDLWRPKYFNGGIAIHGATSIPAQPASHGCARLSFAAMDMVWAEALAEVGTRVVVY
jgi:lipoprotein-anchoring transpeptidase ErfK/SrfK